MTNTPPLAGGALEETTGADVITSITPVSPDPPDRQPRLRRRVNGGAP